MKIVARFAALAITALLGMLNALPAYALQPPAAGAVESEYTFKIHIPGDGVKTSRGWIIGSLLGEEGQSKEAFVGRVAAYLDSWTAATGNEACAKIAQDPQTKQWGVLLLTQHSQFNCITGTDTMRPPFMVVTGESIHSHPPVTDIKPILISRQTAVQARLLGRKALKRGARIRTQDVEHFSDVDIAGGAGYLVTSGRLLYQHGVGTERDLGPVAGVAVVLVASNP